MKPNPFYHAVAILNDELAKAHKQGLSVIVRTNGYPVMLQKGELAQLDVAVNNCKHQWTHEEFLGRRVKGAKDFSAPPDECSVCDLCGQTRDISQ